VETPGDHEMKDHGQLLVESNDDALPQPADGSHWPPDEDVERRFDRAQ